MYGRHTLWLAREGTGNGSMGGWACVATGTDGSGDGAAAAAAGDTLTTSTSLWAVCTGWGEGTIVGPDCNNWSGVTKEGVGVGVSVRRELDAKTAEDADCVTLW